eukprot:gnl/TRDRNA2_/TRDRNA2_90209_c1_seq1.p1 gnl/TRDRNA2_/TRDRNA2_90209_c1~~gnl/TRDRNA2_/TRDRNA2_90209_c1_seq1.p1  ORF type:complete len:264 (-),score=2.14 gnl/TRDRNA2_/TRDRNA2_90209_c1_seq1:64-855(-)
MIKTITSREASALVKLQENGYAEHIMTQGGSLLARIFGLYQVRLPWYRGGKPLNFIVQENVLLSFGVKLTEIYDLKGSQHLRTAKIGDSVMKDNDFIHKGVMLNFPPEACEKLKQQHRRDCEFLASCRVIDYSLLLGMGDSAGKTVQEVSLEETRTRRRSSGAILMSDRAHQESSRKTMILNKKPKHLWNRVRSAIRHSPHGPHETSSGRVLFMGIIDFMITWTPRKKAEYMWRASCCHGKSASCNPPIRYAQRQIDFIAGIF